MLTLFLKRNFKYFFPTIQMHSRHFPHNIIFNVPSLLVWPIHWFFVISTIHFSVYICDEGFRRMKEIMKKHIFSACHIYSYYLISLYPIFVSSISHTNINENWRCGKSNGIQWLRQLMILKSFLDVLWWRFILSSIGFYQMSSIQ